MLDHTGSGVGTRGALTQKVGIQASEEGYLAGLQRGMCQERAQIFLSKREPTLWDTTPQHGLGAAWVPERPAGKDVGAAGATVLNLNHILQKEVFRNARLFALHIF